ncbi:MAG: PUA domain-containing protein [Promethearchaeota archaeon]
MSKTSINKSLLELSRKYAISMATIESIWFILLNFINQFSKKINDKISKNIIFSKDNFNYNENKAVNENIKTIQYIEKFIQNMQKPNYLYAISLNPRFMQKNAMITFNNNSNNKSEKRQNRGALHELYNEWKEIAILDPSIFNISYLRIDGPLFLKEFENKLTIDRFAAESVMIGADLYVPGINKANFNFNVGDLISLYAPGQLHIANGKVLLDKKQMLKLNHGVGIENLESIYRMYPYKTSKFYEKGLLLEQNFSALVACWTLMAQYENDMEILDMCSAPGHKTCTLSQIGLYINNFKDFPKITSVDRSEKRLKTLFHDIKRLKLENISVLKTKLQRLLKEKPNFKENFDLVVLDPPCSALGVIPKLMIEHSWKDLRNYFLLQHLFAKNIDAFVKPGGYLLYNTCSMTILENESIISYFKDKFNYEIIDAHKILSKLFPNRFKTNLKSNQIKEARYFIDLTELFNEENMHSIHFGNELFSGFASDDEFNQFIKMIDEKIEDRAYWKNLPSIEHTEYDHKLHYLSDMITYNTLSESDAKKVVRTYPFGPNTIGYFFALLKKR